VATSDAPVGISVVAPAAWAENRRRWAAERRRLLCGAWQPVAALLGSGRQPLPKPGVTEEAGGGQRIRSVPVDLLNCCVGISPETPTCLVRLPRPRRSLVDSRTRTPAAHTAPPPSFSLTLRRCRFVLPGRVGTGYWPDIPSAMCQVKAARRTTSGVPSFSHAMQTWRNGGGTVSQLLGDSVWRAVLRAPGVLAFWDPGCYR